MRVQVETARWRLPHIDEDEALTGVQSLKAGLRCLRRGVPFGLRPSQDEIDEHPILLARIVEQRQAAVAMAEKPQYRRHALDRVLQRRGRLDPCAAKRRADVDQIAQYLELHRRAAAAMPAIGHDLLRQLALPWSQDPRDPSVRPPDRNEAAEQPLQCAQLRRPGAFPAPRPPQTPHL